MQTPNLIEVCPFEFIYFDLNFNEDENYGRLPPSIYPGVKVIDNRLSIVFDDTTGEVVKVFSFNHQTPELKTELDIDSLHTLDIKHMYEDVYCRHKFGKAKYTKEVLDYLLSKKRISQEYYESHFKKMNTE